MHPARKANCWLALAAVLLLAPSVQAAGEARVEEAPPPIWGSDGAEVEIPWIRVIGATGFVVGLTCLGVYAVKKLDRKGLLRKGQYMDLLEARMVGRKLQLYLVRVGDRVVMLASTGDNVSRVAEFAHEELPGPETADETAEPAGFKSMFTRLLGARQ